MMRFNSVTFHYSRDQVVLLKTNLIASNNYIPNALLCFFDEAKIEPDYKEVFTHWFPMAEALVDETVDEFWTRISKSVVETKP